MLLITDKLIEELNVPELYKTEDIETSEKELLICYKEPSTQWIWYLCEYSKEEKLAFGYVIGNAENCWGYFSLEEMESIYTIQRDETFIPIKVKHLSS